MIYFKETENNFNIHEDSRVLGTLECLWDMHMTHMHSKLQLRYEWGRFGDEWGRKGAICSTSWATLYSKHEYACFGRRQDELRKKVARKAITYSDIF